jgi:hypothetical protein
MLVAMASIGDGCEDDSLVQVRRRIRRWQSRQQTEEPGGPTQLGKTRRARMHVRGKAAFINLAQISEEVGIDEWARSRAVKRVVFA